MAMKEITFSADADLLDRAEQIAKATGTTLEKEVSQWLDDYGARKWKTALQSDAHRERKE